MGQLQAVCRPSEDGMGTEALVGPPQLRLLPGGAAGLGGPAVKDKVDAPSASTRRGGIVSVKMAWPNGRPSMAGADL